MTARTSIPRRIATAILAAFCAVLAVGASPVQAAQGTSAVAANPYDGCRWYNPDRATYQFGWSGEGDKVWLRDCNADGWGAKVSVYMLEGTNWKYTGLTLHDPSAAGDGGWKGMDLPEGKLIMLHGYSYRGGTTLHHMWDRGCRVVRYRQCYNTSARDGAARLFPNGGTSPGGTENNGTPPSFNCLGTGDSANVYVHAWSGAGDQVGNRDCNADGWGVKTSVYKQVGTNWKYTGLTLHDPSAAGDGGWKAKDLPEGREPQRIMLHTYSYRGGKTRNHVWDLGCHLVWGQHCFNTTAQWGRSYIFPDGRTYPVP